MKITGFVVVSATCLLATSQSHAQTSASQVAQVMKGSFAAQSSSGTLVHDVIMSGNAEWIAGSDDETAPITLKAMASGFSLSALSLPSGTQTESRQATSVGNTGTWSGGDGQSHAQAGHNVLTDAAWFFPLLIVQRLLSDTTALVSYVGVENGLAHFQSVQQTPSNLTAAATAQVQHLTEIDLYIDPTTLLPAKLTFNIHPDNNALVDIPVSVQYSQYEQVSGYMVPMHVQKYLNETLALDIHIQSTNFNAGLTAADFATN